MADCPTCNKTLSTESGMKKHHAHVHGKSLTQMKWTCSWCDEEFNRAESQISNKDKPFCSKECHGKWISEYEHTRITVKCEYCDSEFQRRQSQLEKRENYFCSHECHGDWKLEQGSVIVNCEVCDSTVTKHEYYAKRCEHHFCSTDCQGTWYSKNYAGEDSHHWKGGSIGYYGPTWYSQRRNAIERDDEQCQDCGLTRDEYYDEYGRDLEVHHITPIRTFTDTEEANQLSNLITLCKSCHIQRENE